MSASGYIRSRGTQRLVSLPFFFMKLYKVEVTYEIVMLAESREQAEQDAPYIIRNEDDSTPNADATEITAEAELPGEWDARCLPFGTREKPERTIGQILVNKR